MTTKRTDMNLDRTDALVAAITAATLLATIGMLADVWQIVYYALPVFVLLFMLMGSLNARNQWSSRSLAPVIGFSAVLAALFIAAGVLLESTTRFGGMPVASGLFLYVIWPLTVFGAPLTYAVVYSRWLAPDLTALGEATS